MPSSSSSPHPSVPRSDELLADLAPEAVELIVLNRLLELVAFHRVDDVLLSAGATRRGVAVGLRDRSEFGVARGVAYDLGHHGTHENAELCEQRWAWLFRVGADGVTRGRVDGHVSGFGGADAAGSGGAEGGGERRRHPCQDRWECLVEQIVSYLHAHPSWSALETAQQERLTCLVHEFLTPAGLPRLQVCARRLGDAEDVDDPILDAM